MAKFQEALEKGTQALRKLIKQNAKGIEEGWHNKEENGFTVNFSLKFNTKDSGDIKVQSNISCNKDVLKDSAVITVTDQGDLPGVADEKKTNE